MCAVSCEQRIGDNGAGDRPVEYIQGFAGGKIEDYERTLLKDPSGIDCGEVETHFTASRKKKKKNLGEFAGIFPQAGRALYKHGSSG